MNVKIMNRISRVLVCLLLICCILLNCSPIRAKAIDPVTTGIVAAASVVGSIFISLGVQAAADVTVHSELVQSCISAMEEATDWVSDGMMKVSTVLDGVLNKAYIPQDVIDFVFDFLWGTKVLSVPVGVVSIPANTQFYINYSDYLIPYSNVSACAWYYNSTGMCQVCLFSNSPFSLYSFPRGNRNSSVVGSYSYYCVNASADTLIANGISIASADAVYGLTYDQRIDGILSGTIDLGDSSVITDYDLTLSDVALYDVPIARGYPEWSSNAITIEDASSDSGTTTAYPLSLSTTYEEVSKMTQTEAQAGTISAELAELRSFRLGHFNKTGVPIGIVCAPLFCARVLNFQNLKFRFFCCVRDFSR